MNFIWERIRTKIYSGVCPVQMGTRVPKFVLFQRKSKGHECIKSTLWVELNTASDVPHAEESCLQVLQRTTPVSTGFAKSLGPSCRSNNWKPGLERDCNCGGCVQHTYWNAYLDWQPMPQLLDYWAETSRSSANWWTCQCQCYHLWKKH